MQNEQFVRLLKYIQAETYALVVMQNGLFDIISVKHSTKMTALQTQITAPHELHI